MTFTNVGATGSWPRRLDRAAGDPACTYKDGADTWGAHCCMEEHTTQSTALSPFDEEMTLIMKAIDVKQLAVYQPAAGAESDHWNRVTAWDRRSGRSQNLWFTQSGEGKRSLQRRSDGKRLRGIPRPGADRGLRRHAVLLP